MRSKAIESFGWLGVVMVLGSYALLSLGILDGNSVSYHLLVLIGSLALALISFRKKAYQPMFLNGIFCILASVALIRLILL